jgi:hypothetical protein
MATIMVEVPDDLKAALECAAAASSRSEADLICEGIGLVLALQATTPTLGILVSDDPYFAHRVDDKMVGFGQA